MAPNITKNINIGLAEKKIKAPSNSVFELFLLVIICCLFTWFIVLPKKAEVDSKKAQLAQLTGQENQTSSELNTFNQLVQDLNNNSTAEEQLDNAMPLDGSTIRLQLLVQNMANSLGVTIGSISLSGNSGLVAGNATLLQNPYGASRSLQQITGSIDVSGTFGQLQAFLQAIENSQRIMDITSLEMSSGQNGTLNLNLDLKTYYLASQ